MPIWSFRNTKLRSQMSYMWSGIGDEPLPETWTDIHAFIQKTNPKLFFTDGTGNTGNRLAVFIDSTVGKGSIGTVNSIPLYFRTGNVDRMYVDTDGHLNMKGHRVLNVSRIERTVTDDILYIYGGTPAIGPYMEFFGDDHATRPGELTLAYTWKKADGTLTGRAIRMFAKDASVPSWYELFSINYDEVKSFKQLNMNSQKITNLASPTVSTDAATKGYVDGIAPPVKPFMIWFSGGSAQGPNEVRYYTWGEQYAVEAYIYFRFCRDVVVKNLAVNVPHNSLSVPSYVIIRKNQTDTILQVEIPAYTEGNMPIDTDSVSFTSSDVLSIKVSTINAPAGESVGVNGSFEVE